MMPVIMKQPTSLLSYFFYNIVLNPSRITILYINLFEKYYTLFHVNGEIMFHQILFRFPKKNYICLLIESQYQDRKGARGARSFSTRFGAIHNQQVFTASTKQG